MEQIIAGSILVFVTLIGGCSLITNDQDNKAIDALVQKGVDPLEAKCVIRTEPSAAFCLVLASKKTNKE
jgi:hypothetical protein